MTQSFVDFALGPVAFEIQSCRKSQMHRITSEWPWTLHCQKHPVHAKYFQWVSNLCWCGCTTSRSEIQGVETQKCTEWPTDLILKCQNTDIGSNNVVSHFGGKVYNSTVHWHFRPPTPTPPHPTLPHRRTHFSRLCVKSVCNIRCARTCHVGPLDSLSLLRLPNPETSKPELTHVVATHDVAIPKEVPESCIHPYS